MKTLSPLLVAALLAGCQPQPSPPPPPDDSSRALERAVQEPLDKARAVKDQLKEGREKQDKEIEEGGG
jgi:hypothetical protein